MSAMHLRLSLPPRADTPDTTIEIRPVEMERWLESRPCSMNQARSRSMAESA